MSEEERAPRPAGRADSRFELSMACISLVAQDMYAGLVQHERRLGEAPFMEAALLYHRTKWGLCEETQRPVPVDDQTYFLLKKCIFHWMQGIKLALVCAGLDAARAQRRAAEGCERYLKAPPAQTGQRAWEKIRERYFASVSGPVREQYALAGAVPADAWCAWLELEAAKTAAFERTMENEGKES